MPRYSRRQYRSARAEPLPVAVPTEGEAGRVAQIYLGSNGDATKALYDQLTTFGPVGVVAVNIFRAQKASERAKKYRGGAGGQSYRAMAYERKQWSIGNLAQALGQHAESIGIVWGWARDAKEEGPHHHLLYIDLPTGQISWHGGERGPGPDYAGQWDGVRAVAPHRICTWIGNILEERRATATAAQ